MFSIRRQLVVKILALALVGIASARSFAQPSTGPTGPAAPAAAAPNNTPAPNRVTFTKESLPQMLKQLGYNVTEKNVGNVVYWQVVTQSENWNFTVQVIPMVHQDKITSLLLSSDLGRKVSPQASAQDVLKLLQWNQEQGFMVYFGYNAQSGCITAQRPFIFPDATLEEMRFLFEDYFKTIRTYHAVWNPLSGPAPAAAVAPSPAGNGAPAPIATPAPAPIATPAAAPIATPAPAAGAPVNIVGTTWNGMENLPGFGKLTFVFNANGAATMVDAKGQTEGSWTQNGAEVTIQFNGCVYQGRINGQTLAGTGRITAGAQAGQTWSFQVAKQ